MENKANGLEYLGLLISCYIDHEDKGINGLLLSILEGIERMMICE
jgi:hypothetical protein